jgi:hypothetical protein
MKKLLGILALCAFNCQAADVVLGRMSDLTWMAGSGANRIAQWGSYVSATGGNVTNYTDGGINYRAHIFTNSGTFTVTSGGSVDALIVAGGGGGARGGGGAGGYAQIQTNIIAGAYTVTVGSGGGGTTIDPDDSIKGANGLSSTFANITMLGGGGGGNYTDGANGGSGGGSGVDWVGGLGASGFGYDGGSNKTYLASPYPASGGGGAGGRGGNVVSSSIGGVGGIGITNSLSGVALGYAGGGGGGVYSSGTGGTASYGGGSGGQLNVNGNSGAANTGSGGGGCGQNSTGGNGGSGIVIIRYRQP